MAETAAKTYATTAANVADTVPNSVAVDVDTAGFLRQVMQIGDKTSNNVTVHPAGFLRVTDEPRQLFYDPFDTTLDVANVWTTPTVGNSAVLAVQATGTMTMGTGTTASGWSKLFSLPTFKPSVPSWLGWSAAISLPDGAAPTANSYRFWGMGTVATTPTTAAPLTDAVGFEMTTAGHLCAVVYAAGVRTQIADLNGAGQPTDTAQHRYIVYIRTDKAYWYIDGLDGASLKATSNFQAPNVQTLPAAFVAVGGATPPASNTQIVCNGVAVWDEGKNSTQIADGTYPWRKQTVNAAGAASVAIAGTTVGQAPMAASQPVVLSSDQSTLPMKSGFATQTDTFASTGTQNGVAYDCMSNGLRNVSVAITTIGASATVNFQTSGDNVTWMTQMLQISSAALATPGTSTTAANQVWAGAVFGRYFRIQITGQVSGTTTVISSFGDSAVTHLSPGGQIALNGTASMNVGQIASATTLTGNGVTGTGSMRVTLASDTTSNTNPFSVRTAASNTSSSLTTAKILSAASTNATSVKGTQAAIYGYELANTSASWRYVRIFSKATAPTVGTDSPAFVIPLPPGGGQVMSKSDLSIPLGSGFAYAITGAAADLDTTVVAANDVVGAIWYA